VDIINYIYDDYLKGFMSNKFDITQMKYRQKMKSMREYTYLSLPASCTNSDNPL